MKRRQGILQPVFLQQQQQQQLQQLQKQQNIQPTKLSIERAVKINRGNTRLIYFLIFYSVSVSIKFLIFLLPPLIGSSSSSSSPPPPINDSTIPIKAFI